MPNDSPRGAAPSSDVDERLLRIEAVTDAALAHLDLDELLQALLERIAEALEADTCAFLLLDQSSNELIARAARGIEEEVEQGVRIPVGQGFAGRIAADRHPVIIEDVDHADVLNPILREKGIKSLLGVPLLVGGDILGVLHVGSLTPRDFTRDDAELLQLAADRAAYAIDHSRMYGETKRTAETLQRLQSITDAALTTMSLGDLLQELVDRVRDAIEVDTCAILLLDKSCTQLVARAARGIEEEVEQGVRIPVGGGFAGRIAAEERTIMLPDVDHADVLNPILRQKGIKSLLGAPLVSRGKVFGVIHVGTLRPHVFDENEVSLLELAAAAPLPASSERSFTRSSSGSTRSGTPSSRSPRTSSGHPQLPSSAPRSRSRSRPSIFPRRTSGGSRRCSPIRPSASRASSISSSTSLGSRTRRWT
jgi:GAF domain-containing protein